MTFPNFLERDFDYFDKLFNMQQAVKNNNFPRASIYIDNDEKLTFHFALAGYSKDEIQITFDEDKLIINGRKDNKPLEAKKVFQNQIAYRDFEVTYRIPTEYIYPESNPEAVFQDGILQVKLTPRTTSAVKRIEIK